MAIDYNRWSMPPLPCFFLFKSTPYKWEFRSTNPIQMILLMAPDQKTLLFRLVNITCFVAAAIIIK